MIAPEDWTTIGFGPFRFTIFRIDTPEFGLFGLVLERNEQAEGFITLRDGITRQANYDLTGQGQASTADRLVFLHADHLQTPRLATNDTQTVTWRWESLAFGNTAPQEDPDGDGTPTTVNLRFPGQYHDTETGLYYNWFRYYDPSTGRYVTSDPIGLVVDLNTYVYVKNDPLRYIDPLGLFGIEGAIEELKNDTAFIVDENGAFVGIQSFRQMTLCRRQALDQCSIQCGKEVLGIEALSQLLFPIGEKISEEVRDKAMKKTISSLLKALDRLSTIGSMVELASCPDKCSRDPDVIEAQRQCNLGRLDCPAR